MSDLSFLRMSSDRGCSGGRKIAHQTSGGRLSAAGHETVLADIKTNLSSSEQTAPTVEYKPQIQLTHTACNGQDQTRLVR